MQFLNSLKKPAWLIAVICLAFSAFCTLLTYAGGFGGGFMPVIGNLLAMILSLVILGGLLFFLIAKKNEALKYFFAIYFGYWLINAIYSGLNAADWAVQGINGVIVAWAIFEFLAALGLLGVLVLFVLSYLLKKEIFRPLALLVMLGTAAFFFIVMVLNIAAAGANNRGWASFFSAFNTFALPVGLTFTYIYLDGDTLEAAAAIGAKKPAAPAEPVVEETVTEEVVTEETTVMGESETEENAAPEISDPEQPDEPTPEVKNDPVE
ncbi:MAG: hypothetical protein IJ735_05480 [Clostridia bacterium]|nr:hypothetical protein [Clostridia bacterium]